MPLAPGTRVDAYELIRPLGSGGMGEVWLATEVHLRRKVALKLLPADLTRDSRRVARFEQEARAASALSQPNVCVIHALGVTADGQHYIAMEYVEGDTLRVRLVGERLPIREALDIAIQIASALTAAHTAGIVHRDIKPENVMLRPDGFVKVLDFGLAKLTSAAESGPGHPTLTAFRTDAGSLVGTVTYMSPEQARGQPVDARTDIWSLGVMLYEMVAGREPFTGQSNSDVLATILQNEPVPLARFDPDAPPELQRIVGKALRKDRSQRYQTIADLRLDLDALRSELPASLPNAAPVAALYLPTGSTPVPIRDESSAKYILAGLARHKLAAATALLVIAALAVGTVWWMHHAADRSAPSGTRVQRNLTRLTFGGGLQTEPTLSPDGRFLAYASDRAGNFDIWVQPIAGGDPVRVTSEPEPDTQPSWSPDGSTIVFRSEQAGGGLFVVPALGGRARQLTAFGERPAWSHNGTEVLFQVGPSINTAQGRASFHAVPAEGGAPTELATAVLEHGVWKWIAEHPDGRISAVGIHENRGIGFYTFSRSGEHLIKSNVSNVAELMSPNYDRFRFIWNRTGTRLHVEASIDFIDNLWRVEVDPTNLVWLSAERLTTGGASDINAVLSRDETRIAYVQQTSSFRLWSFPFDAAKGRLRGEGTAFSEEGVFGCAVDLSRDGIAALYTVVRPGTRNAEIWVHRFDTAQQQLLVPAGEFPKWVPGKNSIVYNKPRNNVEYTLVLREPNGTERQLSPWSATRQLLATDASPDGHSMLVSAYTLHATPLWLWSLERFADKPDKIVVDLPRGNIWQAQLSPNGRWLAFVPQIGRLPVPEQVAVAAMANTPITEWTPVAPTLSITDKPRWAPDGRTLYFLTSRGGFYNLAGIRFDPDRGVVVGQPFDVTHFTSPSLTVVPLMDRCEIAIAARRVVLPMVSSTGSIWMLDNVDK